MPPPMTEPVCDWKPRPSALTTPEVSVRSNPNCRARAGQASLKLHGITRTLVLMCASVKCLPSYVSSLQRQACLPHPHRRWVPRLAGFPCASKVTPFALTHRIAQRQARLPHPHRRRVPQCDGPQQVGRRLHFEHCQVPSLVGACARSGVVAEVRVRGYNRTAQLNRAPYRRLQQ